MNKVIQGDCLIKLKELEDNSVDSIVTDPPYELGFMGKSGDNTGIANNVDMGKECLRVLKPGGHLLAFGGTRTYHRMAVAIEDAGFEVRDMIEWVYGSGFPKSLNIGKAVDKLQGNEREELNERGGAIQKGSTNWQGQDRSDGKGSGFKEKFIDTKGTSEWEGGGTATKPAHEPICLARKPLSEKSVAENVLKGKTGGINIDGCRVETNEVLSIGSNNHSNAQVFNHNQNIKSEQHTLGRFPANLIHDGSDEVVECFPETKGEIHNKKSTGNSMFMGDGVQGSKRGFSIKDSGNASRFFYKVEWSDEEYQELIKQTSKDIQEKGKEIVSLYDDIPDLDWSPVEAFIGSLIYQPKCKSIIYQAKASKSERNKGCEGLEEKPKTNEYAGRDTRCSICGKFFLSSTNPCNCSEEEFGAKSTRIQNPVSKNNHPTVKPIAIMEYLIKMITPKGGIVLDPFAGSGSTLVAAKKNGYQYIGIELTEEYIPIIEARLSAVKEEKTLFN